MTCTLSTAPVPDIQELASCGIAVFLDFDGTLVDIAASPDEVRVPGELRSLLARLDRLLDGAVAIISGRDLNDLDGHLHPLALASAGGHGGTIRRRAGTDHVSHRSEADIAGLVEKARQFCDRHAGLLCEPKAGGVAIHYRSRPDLGAACRVFADDAVASRPDLEVLAGKMVIEIKAAGVDKGKAIASLMEELPFRGRRPVFIGDDVTDEAAFAEVNRRGGLSIKVGDGDTLARHRLADTADLACWLAALAAAAETEAGR